MAWSREYHMHIKLCGLIFRIIDCQENPRGINFHGNGGMVNTITVRFAKYAN